MRTLFLILFAAFIHASPALAQSLPGVAEAQAQAQVQAAQAAQAVKEEVTQLQLYKGDLQADKTWFIPASEDVAVKLLGAILGGDPRGAAALPITGEIFLVFNIMCLAAGSILLVWTTVLGMVRTATEGEFLGKKWSTTMIPLRFALAVGLLIPTASGFSVGQLGALGGVYMGIGAADTLWRTAATSVVSSQGRYQAVLGAGDVRVHDLMVEVLNAEVCVAAADRYYKDAGLAWGRTMGTNSMGSPKITWGGTPPAGAGNAYADYMKMCGEATLPLVSTANNSGSTMGAIAGTAIAAGGVARAVTGSVAGSIAGGGAAGGVVAVGNMVDATAESLSLLGQRVRAGQMAALIVAADDLAIYVKSALPKYETRAVQEFASQSPVEAAITGGAQIEVLKSSWTPPDRPAMEKAIAAAAAKYQTAVGEVVSVAMRDDKGYDKMLKSVTQSAETQGFAFAGSFFFQMGKISSETNRLLSMGPAMTSTMTVNPAVTGTEYDFAKDAKHLDFGRVRSPQGIVEMASRAFMYAVGAGDVNGSALMVMGMSHFMGFDPTSTKHPLIQLQDSGNALIDYALLGKAALSSASSLAAGGKGATEGVPGAGFFSHSVASLVEDFVSMANYAVLVFLGVGVIKAWVLPMLPVFKWLHMMINFYVSVVTALVALPLFCAAHLHPDGDGMSSEAAKVGYGVLLEIFLRPMLMVMGMIFGYLLIYPMMMLGHYLFAISIGTVAQNFGLASLVGLPVLVVLYCVMAYKVVEASTSAMQSIPAQSISYISLRGSDGKEDMDQHINAVGGVIKGDTKAMFASAAGHSQTRGDSKPAAETSSPPPAARF